MREIRGYPQTISRNRGPFISSGDLKNLPHAKAPILKSGGDDIEKTYATHYIDPIKISELKNQ